MTDTDLDYIVETYGDGDCGIFASALSTITGLPLVLFRLRGAHALHLPDRWPRHAAVMVSNDCYLDACGLASLEEVEKRFEARMLVDYSPALLAYPFGSAPGGIHHDQEQWEDACRSALEMLVGRGLAGYADPAVVEGSAPPI